jgi:hypothetical protein
VGVTACPCCTHVEPLCWFFPCRNMMLVLVSVLILRRHDVLHTCRYESAELYWRLFDCGVPVKHLVYNKVSRVGALAGTQPETFWLCTARILPGLYPH